MAETLSLMEFLQALMADPGLRGDFGQDPQGTLAAHGLADLSPADVHDALVLVQDNQTVEYSLDPSAAPPPPPPAGDDHEAAVEYLARYLGEPHLTGADEQWVDVDADFGPEDAVAPARFAPDDAPLLAPGPAHDPGFGAGAAAPPFPGWDADPTEDPDVDDLGIGASGSGHAPDTGPDGYDPDGYDPDGYDPDVDDLDHLDGTDPGAAGSPDEHGPEDPGTALPGL